MALVTRDHPNLTFDGARGVLDGARRRSDEIRCHMNIAIVDARGHRMAFERMDGAKLPSMRVAWVKAQSAAMRAATTDPSISGTRVIQLLLSTPAIAGPAEQTSIRGGVPLAVDAQVAGAMGASAGTENLDVDVARAGAKGFDKA